MSYVLRQKRLFLVFHSLNRTFDLSVEGTSARKYKRKRYFSFVLRSLIRTFNPMDFRYSRSEKLKYISFFARLFVPLIFQILGTLARKSSNIFGFSLAYSYL